MNPYLVLGVPLEADDATIRRAYLAAIKLAPPDREPQRFQTFNVAYEQIKDETSRHRYTLFRQTPPGDSPLDAFLGSLRWRRTKAPLAANVMKEYLRTCTKT